MPLNIQNQTVVLFQEFESKNFLTNRFNPYMGTQRVQSLRISGLGSNGNETTHTEALELESKHRMQFSVQKCFLSS